MRTVPKGKELRSPRALRSLWSGLCWSRSYPAGYLPTQRDEAPASRGAQGTPDTQNTAHFLLWRKTQRALDESNFHMKCFRTCHFNMPQGESRGRGKALSELCYLKVRFSSLSLCPELFRDRRGETTDRTVFSHNKNDQPASLENIPPASRCGWERVSAPLPSVSPNSGA